MWKKSAKYIVAALILIILTITVFQLFKVQIADMYFSSKYDVELGHVRSRLCLLRDGDIAEIKKICGGNPCRLLRPDFLKTCKKILKKTDIDSMRVRLAERHTENSGDRFLVTVYFENNTALNMNLTLKKQSGVWLVRYLGISEAFLKQLTEEDDF